MSAHLNVEILEARIALAVLHWVGVNSELDPMAWDVAAHYAENAIPQTDDTIIINKGTCGIVFDEEAPLSLSITVPESWNQSIKIVSNLDLDGGTLRDCTINLDARLTVENVSFLGGVTVVDGVNNLGQIWINGIADFSSGLGGNYVGALETEASIVNNGTILLRNNTDLRAHGTTYPILFNYGNINLSSGNDTFARIGLEVRQNGYVTIASVGGRLTIDASVVGTGSYNISSGSSLTFSGKARADSDDYAWTYATHTQYYSVYGGYFYLNKNATVTVTNGMLNPDLVQYNGFGSAYIVGNVDANNTVFDLTGTLYNSATNSYYNHTLSIDGTLWLENCNVMTTIGYEWKSGRIYANEIYMYNNNSMYVVEEADCPWYGTWNVFQTVGLNLHGSFGSLPWNNSTLGYSQDEQYLDLIRVGDPVG